MLTKDPKKKYARVVRGDLAQPSKGDFAYRVAGHESFTCRFAWLPKLVRALKENPESLSDDDQAMVELGVGKNMVRSIRFWAHASKIVHPAKGKLQVSDFGRMLLDQEGLDPYLEDIKSLWLLHWNIATDLASPMLAWDFCLNRWQETEVTASLLAKALQKELMRSGDEHSSATIEQHVDVFIHSYLPTRGKKGRVVEDNLDCPLVELQFLQKVGERQFSSDGGQREAIYSFRTEPKPDINDALLAYCLADFWDRRHKAEATLSLREIAHGHGSPGRIFKLPEDDIRTRLEILGKMPNGHFTYIDSAQLQQVRRGTAWDSRTLLKNVFGKGRSYVE